MNCYIGINTPFTNFRHSGQAGLWIFIFISQSTSKMLYFYSKILPNLAKVALLFAMFLFVVKWNEILSHHNWDIWRTNHFWFCKNYERDCIGHIFLFFDCSKYHINCSLHTFGISIWFQQWEYPYTQHMQSLCACTIKLFIAALFQNLM